jgi:excinuclease ABC subunit A
MTVSEAIAFLPPIPKVVRTLETLLAVGLGYLQLGQEIATLSGGEAQRMRLSRELAKRSSGNTLYLFDEPTIGLHADDIVKLLAIFEQLIEKGNTVVLIEHNLDVIACADHLIDIGPGSGSKGGRIIATGTPEELAQHNTSITAPYLRAHLNFLQKK